MRQLRPEQLLQLSEEYLVDVITVDDVPGLTPGQQQALALRLARRQAAAPRR